MLEFESVRCCSCLAKLSPTRSSDCSAKISGGGGSSAMKGVAILFHAEVRFGASLFEFWWQALWGLALVADRSG